MDGSNIIYLEVNSMEREKNKGIIVLIIVLIIIILGLSGYIVYDKVLKVEEPAIKEEVKEEVKEELVTGNTFKLNDVSCEQDETSNCIKKVKVAYNNENHEVKLKLIELKNETEENIGYSFEVYIDNESAGMIDAGPGMLYDNGFDATVYVVDSKYIAIQTLKTTVAGKVDYVLNFYNDKIKNNDEVMFIMGGQTLCENESCTEKLNELEDIEFDGKSFMFWGQDCDLMKIVKYQVNFDGNNVNKTIVEKSENAYPAGASC